MRDYYIKSKILWEELDSLRLVLFYSYSAKCKCNLTKIITDYRDPEHIICFLKGLGEIYIKVKTQILLMEPLLSINQVFSLVL